VIRFRIRKVENQTEKFYSHLHHTVIRVYDAAGNAVKTHEHKGNFKEW